MAVDENISCLKVAFTSKDSFMVSFYLEITSSHIAQLAYREKLGGEKCAESEVLAPHHEQPA